MVIILLGDTLKKLRGKRTQESVANEIGISRARYSHYENGRSEPDNEILSKLAEYYHVSLDDLFGRNELTSLSYSQRIQIPCSELTEKYERDIAKNIENILEELDSENGIVIFDGKEMDESQKLVLKDSLERSILLLRQLAKQK